MYNSMKSGVARGALYLSLSTGLLGGAYNEPKLESVMVQCSKEKIALLHRVDAIVMSHRAQIQRWYHRSCVIFSRKSSKGCPDIPESVFESYGNGKVDRFCSTQAHNSVGGSRVLGEAPISSTKRPTIVLYPRLFLRQKRNDICEIVSVDFHERIHAVADVSHDSDIAVPQDWIESGGYGAQLACIDALYGDQSANEENRFNAAVDIFTKQNIAAISL